MKCPKCDYDNSANSQFCLKCGAKLAAIIVQPQSNLVQTPVPVQEREDEDEGVCPSCGAVMIFEKDHRPGCMLMLIDVLISPIIANSIVVYAALVLLLFGVPVLLFVGSVVLPIVSIIAYFIAFIIFCIGLYITLSPNRYKYLCRSCSFTMKAKSRAIKERKEAVISSIVIGIAIITAITLLCSCYAGKLLLSLLFDTESGTTWHNA